jgi:hypothetical protein
LSQGEDLFPFVDFASRFGLGFAIDVSRAARD